MLEPEFTPIDPATVSFEPLWDYVLCQTIPQTKTVGGILLPGRTKTLDECLRSLVIKAGPGTWQSGKWVPNPIAAGDIIYHAALQPPVELLINRTLLICISASLLMGVERKAKPEPTEPPEPGKEFTKVSRPGDPGHYSDYVTLTEGD